MPVLVACTRAGFDDALPAARDREKMVRVRENARVLERCIRSSVVSQ